MNPRAFVVVGLLAIAAPSCTVYVQEVGTASADGSVYLGWNLFSSKQKNDREDYPVGQQHGAFSSIRLRSDSAIALRQVVVIFADGERFTAPAPRKLGKDRWSNPVALPGARPIHSIAVTAHSPGKHLAKLEIYGTR